MKNWDKGEEEQRGGYLVRTAVLMLAIVGVIFGIVFYLNRDEGQRRQNVQSPNIAADQSENREENNAVVSQAASGDTRTSDELDIWDEDYMSVLEVTPTPTAKPQGTDITTDGNHTMITYADGSTDWVTISGKISRNTYLDANFMYQTPIMKYYHEGALISYMGVMVSEEQDYVDYIKLKNAGVDFVLVCIGARDPVSGELKEDTQFAQNMKNAADAELMVGVWFCSQAKDEEEAQQEAEFICAHLEEYEISYPVVCVWESSEDESARTAILNKTERTKNVLALMEQLEDNGYATVFGANKEYLILKFDLTELENRNILLLQAGDLPDYPYFYSMWSYDNAGVIDGIADTVRMVISMKDFLI